MPRIGLAVALALLAGIALAATGCTSTSGSLPDADVEEDADLPPPEDIVSGLGTVRYVEMEGGFYGIVADDSTRYLPQDLGTDYREDGLRVRFRAAGQRDDDGDVGDARRDARHPARGGRFAVTSRQRKGKEAPRWNSLCVLAIKQRTAPGGPCALLWCS
jgi:hypothetical protein